MVDTMRGFDAVEMALISGSLADACRVALAIAEVAADVAAHGDPESSDSSAVTVAPKGK